jgi:hypothetical protein
MAYLGGRPFGVDGSRASRPADARTIRRLSRRYQRPPRHGHLGGGVPVEDAGSGVSAAERAAAKTHRADGASKPQASSGGCVSACASYGFNPHGGADERLFYPHGGAGRKRFQPAQNAVSTRTKPCFNPHPRAAHQIIYTRSKHRARARALARSSRDHCLRSVRRPRLAARRRRRSNHRPLQTQAARRGECVTFQPPRGPGRCSECGHHVRLQGHRDGCPRGRCRRCRQRTAYRATRKCEECLRHDFERGEAIRARVRELENLYRRGETPGQRRRT